MLTSVIASYLQLRATFIVYPLAQAKCSSTMNVFAIPSGGERQSSPLCAGQLRSESSWASKRCPSTARHGGYSAISHMYTCQFHHTDRDIQEPREAIQNNPTLTSYRISGGPRQLASRPVQTSFSARLHPARSFNVPDARLRHDTLTSRPIGAVVGGFVPPWV